MEVRHGSVNLRIRSYVSTCDVRRRSEIANFTRKNLTITFHITNNSSNEANTNNPIPQPKQNFTKQKTNHLGCSLSGKTK
ncbi:hypothetical protein E2C01_083726 [Portunus trituberculatus]|uniref:Uncharacterized protein n=1 Tax=Portunus trituberculatus TaxID=210409 RepID=A0A5B7J216_PORTR|nr:hypothetical protein [Portunus trituberculatus]